MDDVCYDGGYLFCSFLKDSIWEFVWASTLFWLRFFNRLIISFVPISRAGMLRTMKDLLPEWGIFRW